jgi:hypothetical protein
MISSILVAWQLFNAPVVYAKEPEREPTREEVILEIQRVFPKNWKTMSIIALCESNYKNVPSLAKYEDGNPEESFGIYQIHTRVHKEYDPDRLLHDYKYNISAAREIYDKEGIRAWFNCARDNKVLK